MSIDNEMICKRLEAFRAELARKSLDNQFTVNETRFICERAMMLIRNYSSIGMSPLKERTVAGLKEALEQADAYSSGYEVKNHTSNIPYTEVVAPALQAITTFLAQAR